MRQNISPKQRKVLETKMVKVFKPDIKMLSEEMQEILVDDLVTAFLNRLNVLTCGKNNDPNRDLVIHCSNDTLELVHAHPRQA